MPNRSASQITSMLFDLDGTLLDTAPDFAQVLDDMTRHAGLPPVPDIAVRQTVSSGARALVQLAFGIEEGHAEFPELLKTMLERYGQQITRTRSVLYPGMTELLDALEARRIKWGIVTNKSARFSIPLLENLGLLRRCQTLICPEHVTYPKPHPEPLLLACTQLNCTPEHSVYVGDHPRDIVSGLQAGMFTVAAAYGYLPVHPPLAEWNAHMIATSVDAITHWLNTPEQL